MEIRNIGVLAEVDKIDQDLVAATFDLARHNHATVIGITAAAPPIMPLTGMEGIDVAGAIYADQYADAEASVKAAGERFAALVPHGVKHRWEGSVQRPDDALLALARSLDLVVVGSALPHPTASEFDLASVLLGCGRPVLLPARGLRKLKTGKVLVAWKDTRESRRAVADALPLLKLADEVTVVVVDEGNLAAEKASMSDVVGWLISHDVKAHGDVLPEIGGVPTTIQNAARAGHADLVVAGAYGHSRLREWLFGGVTQELIKDAEISRFLSN